MRLTPLQFGLGWFVLSCALVFAFGPTGGVRPLPPVLEPRALAAPPAPYLYPTPPEPREATVEQAGAAPDGSDSRPAVRPEAPARSGSRPRAPETVETEPPEPAPTPDTEVARAETPTTAPARCLVCGAPAASWVETDGKKVGYCTAHLSPLAAGAASAASVGTAPAPALSTAAAPTPTAVPTSQTGGLVQCKGTTRSGHQCRRKTRDSSGYCYQHRP